MLSLEGDIRGGKINCSISEILNDGRDSCIDRTLTLYPFILVRIMTEPSEAAARTTLNSSVRSRKYI